MEYYDKIILKDGRECVLRNGTADDGAKLLDIFIRTHEQTDYLLSYPDESTHTVEEESEFLKNATESENGIEMLAEIDGEVVGAAGIGAVGNKFKNRHRAEFGISVDRDHWRLGIGRALTNACIACARKAGYTQLELEAVAENGHALELYKSVGFVEYGRNPLGFRSRFSGWQELVLMRLNLRLRG